MFCRNSNIARPLSEAALDPTGGICRQEGTAGSSDSFAGKTARTAGQDGLHDRRRVSPPHRWFDPRRWGLLSHLNQGNWVIGKETTMRSRTICISAMLTLGL